MASNLNDTEDFELSRECLEEFVNIFSEDYNLYKNWMSIINSNRILTIPIVNQNELAFKLEGRINSTVEIMRSTLIFWKSHHGREATFLAIYNQFLNNGYQDTADKILKEKHLIKILCSITDRYEPKTKKSWKRNWELWNVPKTKKNFIIRMTQMNKIHTLLRKKENVSFILALHGLGGMGKTTIAREYAWKYVKEYEGIFWFNAENKEVLLNEYKKLYYFVIKNNATEHFETQIKIWFEEMNNQNEKPWLIIYDNVDTNETWKDIEDLMPRYGGNILVTTRLSNLTKNEMKIETYTTDEAMSFVFNELIVKEQKEMRKKLCKILGNLPLAISISISYINECHINIADYINIFEELRKNAQSTETHSPFKYSTWDITFQKIKELNQNAFKWIIICGFLDGFEISVRLLKAFVNLNKIEQNNITKIVNSYSLLTLTKEKDNFLIHPLIKDHARTLVSEENARCILKEYINLFEAFEAPSMEQYAIKKQNALNMTSLFPYIQIFDQYPSDQILKEISKYFYWINKLSIQSNLIGLPKYLINEKCSYILSKFGIEKLFLIYENNDFNNDEKKEELLVYFYKLLENQALSSIKEILFLKIIQFDQEYELFNDQSKTNIFSRSKFVNELTSKLSILIISQSSYFLDYLGSYYLKYNSSLSEQYINKSFSLKNSSQLNFMKLCN